MVQATLDDIRKNDTAKLFRDDADIMAIRPSAAPANNRITSPFLRNDDEGKPKGFDPNGDSDSAILLRRSGYRQTDEKTREGVYHVSEERSETKIAERAAVAAAQAAANATLAQQAKSWWKSCTNAARSIGDSISGAVDTVTEYASNAIDKVGQTASDMWKSVKSGAASIGTSLGNGFNTYVAKPFDTYVAKPVTSFVGAAQEKASSAWSATKSFFGYDNDATPAAAQPATRTAAPAPAAAAAQPLAGQKNNVSSGLSLSSAWDAAGSAADSVSTWWNGPAAKPVAPAPQR